MSDSPGSPPSDRTGWGGTGPGRVGSLWPTLPDYSNPSFPRGLCPSEAAPPRCRSLRICSERTVYGLLLSPVTPGHSSWTSRFPWRRVSVELPSDPVSATGVPSASPETTRRTLPHSDKLRTGCRLQERGTVEGRSDKGTRRGTRGGRSQVLGPFDGSEEGVPDPWVPQGDPDGG